jgi:hypothetical protein
MASLTLSLAAALTACWSATPEPITTVVTAISEAFQVTDVQAFNTGVNSQAATGTTASSTGISISFDQPVNRASVEQSVNIFEGEINHDTNPTPNQFTKLGLTSMCNGYWRVRNPNTMPISFTWDAFKTPENGAGVVQANSDTFFTSSLNADTIRVHVNNKQQQVKAKNPAACTSSPMTFAWAADSKSVVASPKTALVLNKTYSVVVSTFAKNSSGSAALSVPFVSKVVVQENSSTSGTLVPGGSFTSRDGVVISAPDGVINQPINVFVEPTQASQFPLSMPEGVEPVGKAFRIGGTQTKLSKKLFDIALPAPVYAPGEDIRLYVFSPIPFVSRPADIDNGGAWEEEVEDLDSLNRFHSSTPILAPQAFIFSFGKVLGSVRTSSIRTFSDPLTGVACVGNLAKNGKKLCPVGKTTAILATLNDIINALKFDLNVSSSAFEYLKPPLRISDSTEGRCNPPKSSPAAAFYDDNPRSRRVTICYSVVDGSFSSDIVETLRHELFHAIQFYFWDVEQSRIDYWTETNFDKVKYKVFVDQQIWMIEGTAALMELSSASSTSLRAASNYYKSRNITKPLAFYDPASVIQYQTEDFWAYLGNQNNTGLSLVKHLLDQGKMSNSVTFADNAIKSLPSLSSPDGLKDAYWQWAKSQAYEWKNPYRNLNYPAKIQCVLDNTFADSTTTPDSDPNNNVSIISSLSTAGGVTVPAAPVNVESLSTRVYRVKFAGPIKSLVKITLNSGSTELKFKAYKRKISEPSGAVCAGKEGSTRPNVQNQPLNNQVNFDADIDTEILFFVANTDFATASSFTVTVEAVGKPGMNIIPPAPLSIAVGSSRSGAFTVSNTGDIGSTLEYQVYNATQGSLDLASVNNRVSTATLRSTGIAKVYPPAPPFDTWNGGSISVGGGIGNLAKDASQTYSFAVNCTKPGGHTARIPVAYYTGEVNLSNVEQVAEADVSVQVECVGGPIPIPDNSNLSIVGLTEKPWVVNSNYTVSVFTVRNIGDAPYRYTPDGLADVGGILNEGDRSPDVIPVGGTKEFRVQADCPTSGPYRKTGLVSIKGLLGTSSAGINVRKEISVWCKPRDFNNTVFNEYLPAYYSGIENTYLVKIPNEWQACPGDSVYFDSTVNGANVAIVRPGTTTGQRNTFGDAAQVVNESGQIEMNIGAIGGSIANANISVSATLFEVDEGGTRTSVGNCVWNDATYKFTRIP